MRIAKLMLGLLAFGSQVFAQDVKIVGTIDTTLKIPQTRTVNAVAKEQTIKLMKIELSNSASQDLNKRMTAIGLVNNNYRPTLLGIPTKVQLGMDKVPVLNQGQFGTCVTFATTAAINAALKKGDYVSQLCPLQLGLHLEQNGYGPSGWEGSFGRNVLNQLENFGVVSKEKQRSLGCGGLTNYPHRDQPKSDSAMSLEQYHQMSESIERLAFSSIVDVYQAFVDKTDKSITLNDVKKALNEKDRVTFGVLLVDFDKGVMGAVGSHNTKFDTWVITPELTTDTYGGHEMVITGYDDNAIATDDKGRKHKGLLTLRNSWGELAGDNGNFYMSYDYFKVLVMEAHRIRTLPSTNENANVAVG